MTKPVISIIVPVYNTEKYLARCMESILSQTFRDIEIILVDDGSQDGSGKLCDDIALRDERVRVLHQKNAGVSAARNAGIEAARGEWLGFVDSDDWIDAETYATAYKTAIEQNADMVMWGCFLEYGDYNVEEKYYEGGFNISDIEKTSYAVMNHAVQKLIKKDLLDNFKIRFPENISVAEDLYFSFLCICNAINRNGAYMLSKCFYHYIQVDVSAMHTMNTEKIMQNIDVAKKLEQLSLEMNIDSQIAKFLYEYKMYVKNLFLFSAKPIRIDLWRKTFPEENKKCLSEKRFFAVVYWAIFLHLDFLVKLLVKVQKKLHSARGLK